MPTQMSDVMQVVNRHKRQGFAPKIAVILGSGFSALADEMTDVNTIPYQAIPGLQVGNVAGHASQLAMGKLNGNDIVCLKGRLHLYEGTSYDSIRTLVRITKHLGCDAIVVTGAVGSLMPEAGPGELLMVTDHINFQPGNPMVGPNDESIGPRFFGMEDAYNPGLAEAMETAADRLGIRLHQGVYISTLGPSFETPAEIRAFRTWGADVVGMSVVPEVIVARHCGMKVVAITAVTNAAAGLSNEKITHEGTLRFGEMAARNFTKLIPEFIKEVLANAVV